MQGPRPVHHDPWPALGEGTHLSGLTCPWQLLLCCLSVPGSKEAGDPFRALCRLLLPTPHRYPCQSQPPAHSGQGTPSAPSRTWISSAWAPARGPISAVPSTLEVPAPRPVPPQAPPLS